MAVITVSHLNMPEGINRPYFTCCCSMTVDFFQYSRFCIVSKLWFIVNFVPSKPVVPFIPYSTAPKIKIQ
jgi:hypothetical protein